MLYTEEVILLWINKYTFHGGVGLPENIETERVVYFADPFMSIGCNSLRDEFNQQVGNHLEAEGITFRYVVCTSEPPFRTVKKPLKYSILFFDWGGASYGNSMLDSYCRVVLREASENPNILYVLTSTLTKYAMKDALVEFGEGNVPANLFMNIYRFIEYYKAILNIKQRREIPKQ